ncbi:uncharacterized protein METZ01_LOCUS402980, partial [marine metagenome]
MFHKWLRNYHSFSSLDDFLVALAADLVSFSYSVSLLAWEDSEDAFVFV